jgi:hypothetical protein
MRSLYILAVLAILLSTLIFNLAFAGTTGKIVGTVTDARTGEKLVAANVVVQGANLGASTNLDGFFVILNIPPGTYRVRSSLVGYTSVTQVDVRVEIDQTTAANFKMSEETVQAQEVVIVAERPVVQKDISASRTNLTIAEVDKLPVVNVATAVGLQAGIEPGLVIRGGGSDQTAFMLDGQVLRDERTNAPYTAISLSSIQDIQVQTGGFNAEYGNIRSGVVNVVTKEGGRNLYNFSITSRYAPARPKHFGASIYDKNSYWIRPYVDPAVAWTGTQNGAWDQWTQQQYPQFEGWNAVSQKTLKDADPTNDLTPLAAQQLFLWEHRKQAEVQNPDYDVDMGFGGPFPFVSEELGNLRFFASYRRSQVAYLIPLSRTSFNDYNGQLKITSDVASGMKVTVEGMLGRSTGTNDNNSGLAGTYTSPSSIAQNMTIVSYIDSRIFSNDYWAPTQTDYTMVGAKVSHVLNPTTFYDASIHVFRSKYSTNPDRLRDTSRIYLFGNSYLVDEAPFGFQPQPSTGITGLRMGVGWSNSRDSSVVANWTAKFDLTSQLDKYNQFKGGVEFVYTDNDVNYRSVDVYLPSGRSTSTWHTFPKRGSAYLQDKLEFEGMIANIGLRLDYLDPGGKWYVYGPFDRAFTGDLSLGIDTLLQKVSTKKNVTLSPRLGVAFPISENAKLFFNYGHFRSLPTPENLFLIRRFSDNNAVTRLANPNDDLPKTVAYELGYEHNLWDQFLFRAAAYYKDVTNEPKLVTYTSRDNKVNYSVSTPNTYEDIRGFELTFTKNRGPWVQGFLNYTYDVSTAGYFGLAQYYESASDQRIYERNNVYQEKPIPQPYARANIDFFTPNEFGPSVGGISLLGGWRLDLVGSWASGFYFTYTGGGNIPGILNNVQWTDTYNVDMRVSKSIEIGRATIQLFADVSNLFNFKQMTATPANPGFGFVDGNDFNAYMKSLHLAGDIGDKLGYGNIPGDDRPGDYRKEGVDFQPIVSLTKFSELSNPQNQQLRPFYYVAEQKQYYQFVNGSMQPVDPGRLKQVLDDKAYIDMPNMETLTFLNPRRVFFGARFSFDF